MAVNNTSSSTSATAYPYLQYKNKIGGLVSGMDIDSIMEKLMKAESAQMEKLQQQKQKYEWKRDSYREVNTSLTAFEQGLFDNYGKPSNWAAKTVSNSDSSKVSVTAGSSASGNLTVNVTQVATAFSAQTTVQSGVSSSTTMADLGFNSGGSFIMSSLKSDGTMDDGVEITYSATDTVDSVLKNISQKTGVSAIMLGDKISFTNKNTGAPSRDASGNEVSIDIKDDTNRLFSSLGFTVDNTKKVDFSQLASKTNGTNAVYTVNGISQETASNKFSVSGYTVEVKAKTDSSVSISSTTDTDKIVDKVKEFIETYNGLIKDLNTRVSEKRNIDYAPLTDAQKAEMTEAEITKWEEKAKAGLLKGDSNINTALSSMRSTIATFGSGTQDMLYKIGITTTKTWSDNGKLELNEDKLRAAIEQDPDVVSRIFTGEGTTDGKGLVGKLRDSAQTAVKNIEKTAGKSTSTSVTSYTLGKSISDLDTKISDWKDRLKDIEERYWKQFSAMETAIQKANSQSSIFSAS